MGGSGSEELMKCPPPSPAVLWFVNAHERKPTQKKPKKPKKQREMHWWKTYGDSKIYLSEKIFDKEK